MVIAELIEKLKSLPQDAPVFCKGEYDDYTPIKHADFVESDEFGNDPHVQLTEYGQGE